jgi:hypothetical protein
MVNATPRPLYPLEKPCTHCIGGWVGHRAGLDICRKSRSNRDSIPGPSSPVESRYADRAIPAPGLNITFIKIDTSRKYEKNYDAL